jgi:linoleoyl-CoA desaturase
MATIVQESCGQRGRPGRGQSLDSADGATTRVRVGTKSPRQVRLRNARAEAYGNWLGIALVNNLTLFGLSRTARPTLVTGVLAVLLSVGFALGGLTVLHHAGHKRYSRGYLVNMLVVQSAVPIGFWLGHWGLKHRVHHRVPAVYPDDSFTTILALRLHPAAPLHPWHRYQHVYAWLIYCLAWPGDLASQLRFLVTGRITGESSRPEILWRVGSFAAEKAFAVAILSAYVLVARNATLMMAVIGFALVLGSFLTACVVVVGHINEGMQYRSTVDQADMSEPSSGETAIWTNSVLATTASFSVDNVLLGCVIGGMTLHAAHHMRPLASRGELRTVHAWLAEEGESAARPPVIEFPTLWSAVKGHRRTLWQLGRREQDSQPVSRSVMAAATSAGASIIGK